MQSFDWASGSGTSASAWLNHGGVESQTEQIAATYAGRGEITHACLPRIIKLDFFFI
jgi:hypothetical protein